MADLAALVNDLLDVSVIESGKLELRREPLDLAQLLRQRVRFFRLLAERKGITIDEKIPLNQVLRLDPGRMEQVIDNLVSNAVKYSPSGARVEVSLGPEGRHTRLAVRDEGPGLSTDDQQRLFGSFQRLSSTPTGGEKSTGLGLAITRRIVQAHGGSIEVDSAPGQGSSFAVLLVDRPELSRVLLVDDDEDIRMVARMALEGVGNLSVATCESGEEALATIPSFGPDLVLLDVEMPGLNGPATLSRLQADSLLAEIPVIFLTARAGREQRRTYRELGAVGVIAKPFDPLELHRQILAIWG